MNKEEIRNNLIILFNERFKEPVTCTYGENETLLRQSIADWHIAEITAAEKRGMLKVKDNLYEISMIKQQGNLDYIEGQRDALESISKWITANSDTERSE